MATVTDRHGPCTLRDQWLLVDADLARKARERRLPSLAPVEALGAALAGSITLDDAGGGTRIEVGGPWLEELRRPLAEPDAAGDAFRQPPALQATLSRTAKALRTIGADAKVALTGTPVENNLSELWAILDWTTPGLLGNLTRFRDRWARPIEAGHHNDVAQRLWRIVRPFLLRRRKSDPGIAPELPPKTETEHPISLTREQVGLYEAIVRETLDQIRSSEGIKRRGLVMKLLTACKQICNRPSHYVDEPAATLTGRSGKLDLLDELVDTIVAEGGAVLVFT